MLAAAAIRGRPLMTRRDDLPQMTLLVACYLTLLALPFVTTYNDLLTTGAIRLGIAAPLQAVSPIEGRMVVAPTGDRRARRDRGQPDRGLGRWRPRYQPLHLMELHRLAEPDLAGRQLRAWPARPFG